MAIESKLGARFSLFPPAASSIAGRVDGIMIGLLILSAIILLIVFGLIAYFGIKYRAGSPHERRISGKGENALEWGWTIGTFIVFMGIFAWGTLTYFKMHAPPPGSLEISVVAKQWMWKFEHPGGRRELDELHVPVGRPILLAMTSEDVIHSFFVPAFRVKQDVLPGRYTYLWFQATKTGQFRLFCTQYCGTAHAGMRGRVVVLPQAQYERWLASGLYTGSSAGGESMASRGRGLFTRMGCVSCHGIQAGIKAPSLYGIYDKPVGLSDGTTVIADENYLRESIVNPGAKIVQGYEDIMPEFSSLLSEEDVMDLIAYIRSLGGTPGSQAPEGPPFSRAIPTPPPAANPTGDRK